MTEIIEFLHYGAIAAVVGINSIAVGIGEGLVGAAAIESIHIQPEAKNDISTTAILGMALVETAAITGISLALILLLGVGQQDKTIYFGLAEIGIVLAICVSGFVIGLVSSWPAISACHAIARQPFSSKRIIRFMLITQSMIQTPIIFGFIIAMFIKSMAMEITTIAESLRLIASGLAIGVGSIGPGIGLAQFGKTACDAIGINRKSYNKIFSFTLISEAIIETPVIFALVTSLIIIVSKTNTLIQGIALVASALCIGIGTIGPGIGSGKTASAACKQIAINPDNYATLAKVSMFCQGLVDTAAIYALLISISLVVFR